MFLSLASRTARTLPTGADACKTHLRSRLSRIQVFREIAVPAPCATNRQFSQGTVARWARRRDGKSNNTSVRLFWRQRVSGIEEDRRGGVGRSSANLCASVRHPFRGRTKSDYARLRQWMKAANECSESWRRFSWRGISTQQVIYLVGRREALEPTRWSSLLCSGSSGSCGRSTGVYC